MITLNDVVEYVEKEKFLIDFSSSNGVHSSRFTLKIYNYSATAQPGYTHQLMFESSGSLEKLCEQALGWLLEHRRKQREASR